MTAAADCDEAEISDVLKPGPFDLRRKAQIARGGPADHRGECVMVPNANFDLEATIFKAVQGALPRKIIRDRLSVIPFWSDMACERISQLFSSVPRAMPHNRSILEFMDKDCNFSMEHADGSFMDHLQFCYEYSAAHFKGHSPQVLLLHSICGVGTNYFPMELSKLPKLKTLVTEEEFMHIEAFPAILRLLYAGPFLEECSREAARLKEIESLTFHRVIDNGEMTMSGEDLLVQLNYQLIHLLDFLPASDWELAAGDAFLHNFSVLHTALSKSNTLMACVNLELQPIAPLDVQLQPPTTLGSLIRKFAPASAQLAMARKQLTSFSAAINHDLSYKLRWKSLTSRL